MTPILSGDNIHVENTGSGYRIHADIPPAPRNASPYEGFFSLQLQEEKDPLSEELIIHLRIVNNRAWINGKEQIFPDFKQTLARKSLFCYLKSPRQNSAECAIFISTAEQSSDDKIICYPLGKVEYAAGSYRITQYNWSLPQLTILDKGFTYFYNGLPKTLEPNSNGVLVWTGGAKPELTTLQLPSTGEEGMLKLTGKTLSTLPLPSGTCILISVDATSFQGFSLTQKDGVLFLNKGNLSTLAVSDCEG